MDKNIQELLSKIDGFEATDSYTKIFDRVDKRGCMDFKTLFQVVGYALDEIKLLRERIVDLEVINESNSH